VKGDKLSSESTSTRQCFESLEHQSKHTQRALLSGKHLPHDLPLCQYLGTLPARLVSPAGFEEDVLTFPDFARCRARPRQTEAVVSPSSTAALSHVCPARRHLTPPQRLEGSGYERLALINGNGFIFRPADCASVWPFALAALLAKYEPDSVARRPFGSRFAVQHTGTRAKNITERETKVLCQ